jgi:hypothetical protein
VATATRLCQLVRRSRTFPPAAQLPARGARSILHRPCQCPSFGAMIGSVSAHRAKGHLACSALAALASSGNPFWDADRLCQCVAQNVARRQRQQLLLCNHRPANLNVYHALIALAYNWQGVHVRCPSPSWRAGHLCSVADLADGSLMLAAWEASGADAGRLGSLGGWNAAVWHQTGWPNPSICQWWQWISCLDSSPNFSQASKQVKGALQSKNEVLDFVGRDSN